MVGLCSVPDTNACDVPDTPPLTPLVVTGADQLYNVPAGTIPFAPLTGDDVNITPLQVTALIGVMLAPGLRVTVNVKERLAPQPVLGVTT